MAALLETAPDDSQNTQLLSDLIDLRSHLRAKSWQKAETLAQTLEPQSGSLTPNLLADVKRLRRSGEYLERAEAEDALSLLEAVELPLLLAERETQRGTAQVFLADAEAAERAFYRATELDPKHYRALTNLGNVMLESGRVDEAIEHYEAALKVNNHFANAQHNLGVAYRRKGHVHKSVQAIRKAQRMGRQQERAAAQNALSVLRKNGRYHWLVWLVVALGAYLLLRALNLI